MLYYGEEQITRQALADIVGVNLAELEKRPSFENKKNVVDRVNGGRIKSGSGMRRRSHFFMVDPKTRLTTIVRYVQSVNRSASNPDFVSYEPRYVEFKGAKKSFQEDLDLALFFNICPDSANSPLRAGNKKLTKAKPKFEFIDHKERSKSKREKIYGMSQAIRHAEETDYATLLILAKGMGMKGIDAKEEEELRADMMEFAATHPKQYMDKSNSELTLIEGRILHLADTGAIEMERIGSTRVWKWSAGDKEGQRITEVINQTEDARKALVKYLMNNLQHNLAVINNTVGDSTARINAQKYLKSIETPTGRVSEDEIGDDLPDYLKEKKEVEETTEVEDKEYRKELMEMLSSWKPGEKKASWGDVKLVFDAVRSGEITKDEIRGFVKKNLDY